MTFVKLCQRDLWTERWNIDNLQFPYSQDGCLFPLFCYQNHILSKSLYAFQRKLTPGSVIWFCYICQILYWDLDLRSRPDLKDILLPFLVFFLVSLHRQYEQIYVHKTPLRLNRESADEMNYWALTEVNHATKRPLLPFLHSWRFLEPVKHQIPGRSGNIEQAFSLKIILDSKSIFYLLTFTLFCKYSSTFPCQQREGCPIHWSYCASYCLSYRVSYRLVSALFLTFILIPANSFGKQPWLDILSLFVGDL